MNPMASKRKNPAAVSLGRKGGKARLKTMTAEQRTAAARKAAKARWKKKPKAKTKKGK
jgi:hypothetical protein